MSTTDKFKTVMTEGYTFKGDYILLGGATMNGKSVTDAQTRAPIKTFNRHGPMSSVTIKKTTLILTLILTLSFAACKEDVDDITGPFIEEYEILELSTDFGNIYLHLYDETPLHKANFDSLVRAIFYDSTEFHRCVDNFVIQGGSPTSKDDNRLNDGSGGPGYTIPAEIDSTSFQHFYGALAAARTGNMSNPERRSSGSQFYIVTDTSGAHFLDGEYTTFGRVLAGMDVAKAIEGQPKNGNDLPNERIKMYLKYVQLSQAQLDEKGIVLPL
jgi:cyclophilin family peptidyl-prolyl cis-trans isomerase